MIDFYNIGFVIVFSIVVPTEVQGRVVDSLETTPKRPIRAFKYLLLGYCAYGGLGNVEIILFK